MNNFFYDSQSLIYTLCIFVMKLRLSVKDRIISFATEYKLDSLLNNKESELLKQQPESSSECKNFYRSIMCTAFSLCDNMTSQESSTKATMMILKANWGIQPTRTILPS